MIHFKFYSSLALYWIHLKVCNKKQPWRKIIQHNTYFTSEFIWFFFSCSSIQLKCVRLKGLNITLTAENIIHYLQTCKYPILSSFQISLNFVIFSPGFSFQKEYFSLHLCCIVLTFTIIRLALIETRAISKLCEHTLIEHTVLQVLHKKVP